MNSSDHSGLEASRSLENDTSHTFRQRNRPPTSDARRALALSAGGLIATPTVLGLAAGLGPHLSLSPSSQDLLTFLSAVATVTGGLFVLAQGRLPKPAAILVGLAAAATLGTLAATGVKSAVAVVLVGTCLMALGHIVGHAIGSRIEHPGHLLPACVVAGCVDLASVIHPKGPTHAVVSSERALDLLTVSFPVLGTRAFAPTIGVGDIVFGAIVFGVAVQHELSTRRVAILMAVALLAAGFTSAMVQGAVPALPAIGFFVVVGFREARVLRKKDRRVAMLFMTGAAVLATAVVASRFIG